MASAESSASSSSSSPSSSRRHHNRGMGRRLGRSGWQVLSVVITSLGVLASRHGVAGFVKEDVDLEEVGERFNRADCNYNPLPTHLSGIGSFSRSGIVQIGDVYGFPLGFEDHAITFSLLEESLVTFSLDLHYEGLTTFEDISIYRLKDDPSFSGDSTHHSFASYMHPSEKRKRVDAIVKEEVSKITHGAGGYDTRVFLSGVIHPHEHLTDYHGEDDLSHISKQKPVHYEIIIGVDTDENMLRQESASGVMSGMRHVAPCVPARLDVQIIPLRLIDLFLPPACRRESIHPPLHPREHLDESGLHFRHDSSEAHVLRNNPAPVAPFSYAFSVGDKWEPFSRGVWSREIVVPRRMHRLVHFDVEIEFRFVSGPFQLLIEQLPIEEDDFVDNADHGPACEVHCVAGTPIHNGQLLDHAFPTGFVYKLWILAGEPVYTDTGHRCMEYDLTYDITYTSQSIQHDSKIGATWMCPFARLPGSLKQMINFRNVDPSPPGVQPQYTHSFIGPRDMMGHMFDIKDWFGYPPDEHDSMEHVIEIDLEEPCVLRASATQPTGTTFIEMRIYTAEDWETDSEGDTCEPVTIPGETEQESMHCSMPVGKYFLRIVADYPAQGIPVCDSFLLHLSIKPLYMQSHHIQNHPGDYCQRNIPEERLSFREVPTLTSNFFEESWNRHEALIKVGGHSKIATIGERVIEVPHHKKELYLRAGLQSDFTFADIRVVVSHSVHGYIGTPQPQPQGSYAELIGPLDPGTYTLKYFYVTRHHMLPPSHPHTPAAGNGAGMRSQVALARLGGSGAVEAPFCVTFQEDTRLLDFSAFDTTPKHWDKYLSDDDEDFLDASLDDRSIAFCHAMLTALPETLVFRAGENTVIEGDYFFRKGHSKRHAHSHSDSFQQHSHEVVLRIEEPVFVKVVVDGGGHYSTHSYIQGFAALDGRNEDSESDSEAATLFGFLKPGEYIWDLAVTTRGENFQWHHGCPSVKLHFAVHPPHAIPACPWFKHRRMDMAHQKHYSEFRGTPFSPFLDDLNFTPRDLAPGHQAPSFTTHAWLTIDEFLCDNDIPVHDPRDKSPYHRGSHLAHDHHHHDTHDERSCAEVIHQGRTWDFQLHHDDSAIRVEANVWPPWLPVMLELYQHHDDGNQGSSHSSLHHGRGPRAPIATGVATESRVLLLKHGLPDGHYFVRLRTGVSPFHQQPTRDASHSREHPDALEDAMDNWAETVGPPCAHVAVTVEVIEEDSEKDQMLRIELLDIPDILPIMRPPMSLNSLGWLSHPDLPVLATAVWDIEGYRPIVLHIDKPYALRIATDPLGVEGASMKLKVHYPSGHKGGEREEKVGAISVVEFLNEPGKYEIELDGDQEYLVTIALESLDFINREVTSVSAVPHLLRSAAEVEMKCAERTSDLKPAMLLPIGNTNDFNDLSTGRILYGVRLQKVNRFSPLVTFPLLVEKPSILVAEVSSDFLIDFFRATIHVPEGRWVGEQHGRTNILRIELPPGRFAIEIMEGTDLDINRHLKLLGKTHFGDGDIDFAALGRMLEERCSNFEFHMRLTALDADLDDDSEDSLLDDKEEEEDSDEEDSEEDADYYKALNEHYSPHHDLDKEHVSSHHDDSHHHPSPGTVQSGGSHDHGGDHHSHKHQVGEAAHPDHKGYAHHHRTGKLRVHRGPDSLFHHHKNLWGHTASSSHCHSHGAMTLPLDLHSDIGGAEVLGGPLSKSGRLLIRARVAVSDVHGGKKRVYLDTRDKAGPSGRLVVKVGVAMALSAEGSEFDDEPPDVSVTYTHSGDGGIVEPLHVWDDEFGASTEKMWLLGKGWSNLDHGQGGSHGGKMGERSVVWLNFKNRPGRPLSAMESSCQVFDLFIQIAPVEDYKKILLASGPPAQTIEEMFGTGSGGFGSYLSGFWKGSSERPPKQVNRGEPFRAAGRVSEGPDGFLEEIPIHISKRSYFTADFYFNFLTTHLEAELVHVSSPGDDDPNHLQHHKNEAGSPYYSSENQEYHPPVASGGFSFLEKGEVRPAVDTAFSKRQGVVGGGRGEVRNEQVNGGGGQAASNKQDHREEHHEGYHDNAHHYDDHGYHDNAHHYGDHGYHDNAHHYDDHGYHDNAHHYEDHGYHDNAHRPPYHDDYRQHNDAQHPSGHYDQHHSNVDHNDHLAEADDDEDDPSAVVASFPGFAGKANEPLNAKIKVAATLDPGSYLLRLASDEVPGRGTHSSIFWDVVGISGSDHLAIPLGVRIASHQVFDDIAEDEEDAVGGGILHHLAARGQMGAVERDSIPRIIGVDPDPTAPIHYGQSLSLTFRLTHPPHILTTVGHEDPHNESEGSAMHNLAHHVSLRIEDGKSTRSVPAKKVVPADDDDDELVFMAFWPAESLHLAKQNHSGTHSELPRKATLEFSKNLVDHDSRSPYQFPAMEDSITFLLQGSPFVFELGAPLVEPWPADDSRSAALVSGGVFSGSHTTSDAEWKAAVSLWEHHQIRGAAAGRADGSVAFVKGSSGRVPVPSPESSNKGRFFSSLYYGGRGHTSSNPQAAQHEHEAQHPGSGGPEHVQHSIQPSHTSAPHHGSPQPKHLSWWRRIFSGGGKRGAEGGGHHHHHGNHAHHIHPHTTHLHQFHKCRKDEVWNERNTRCEPIGEGLGRDYMFPVVMVVGTIVMYFFVTRYALPRKRQNSGRGGAAFRPVSTRDGHFDEDDDEDDDRYSFDNNKAAINSQSSGRSRGNRSSPSSANTKHSGSYRGRDFGERRELRGGESAISMRRMRQGSDQ